MQRNWTVGLFTLALVFLLAGSGFRADPPAKDKPDPKPEKDMPDLVMKEAIKVMGEFADVLEMIKDKGSALNFKPKLVDLKKRFNRDWWDDEQGSLALALDSGKQPVRAVTSNAGHCIACGIVSDDRSRVTVMVVPTNEELVIAREALRLAPPSAST